MLGQQQVALVAVSVRLMHLLERKNCPRELSTSVPRHSSKDGVTDDGRRNAVADAATAKLGRSTWRCPERCRRPCQRLTSLSASSAAARSQVYVAAWSGPAVAARART